MGNMDILNILPDQRKFKKDLLYRLNAAKGGGYMPALIILFLIMFRLRIMIIS